MRAAPYWAAALFLMVLARLAPKPEVRSNADAGVPAQGVLVSDSGVRLTYSSAIDLHAVNGYWTHDWRSGFCGTVIGGQVWCCFEMDCEGSHCGLSRCHPQKAVTFVGADGGLAMGQFRDPDAGDNYP